ncbi:MAG TPA: type II toxin-antitoxin system VapC family toxin [Gemmataceae bacterium]|nr:type II toxin-antitoxin system VapC family toxin [Gemmataceae bacterium]
MLANLLDTDIISLWAVRHPVVVARVNAQPAGTVATSVMTLEEQLTGWLTALRRATANDQRAKAYDRMTLTTTALGRFPIVSVSEAALDRFDLPRAARLNVGPYDLRIAAIALELGATVVTRNLRDFNRIPGPTCEDWSA